MPFILAPLAPVVAGLFALILLIAGILLAEVLQKAGQQLGSLNPFIAVVNALASGISIALHVLDSFLSSIATGVTSLFASAPHALVTLMGSVEVSLWRHINLIRSIITSAIPSLYRTIAGVAASLQSYLISRMDGLFSTATHYTQSVASVLSATISNVANALYSRINAVYAALSATIAAEAIAFTAYALALHNVALATINARALALQQYITGVYNVLKAYSEQLAQWSMATAYGASVEWAKTYSDQTMARAKAAEDALALDVAAPAWPVALPAIDAISLALPDTVAAVLERIGAFPRAIPADAGAIAGVAVGVGTIALDWIRDCGLSLCKNTKGFGNELDALGDAALIATIIELVTEAVRDPEGAATAVSRDLIQPLESAGRELANLIGIGG